MPQNFHELVRAGTVKSPIQLGFKKINWDKAWESCIQDSSGNMLYEAGLIIHEVLAEIRAELKVWFAKHAPKISSGDLLRYYCAIPNRDKFIAIRLSSEQRGKRKGIFGMTTKNNSANNEISLLEVAEGTVDGIQKAILGCVVKMAKKEGIEAGVEPLDLIEFIKGEVNFSQIYKFYEDYWNALLWGGYDFRWINKDEKIAEIRQMANDHEVAFEIGQMRRMRLAMNSAHLAEKIYPILNDKYLILRGSGRQKKYHVENVRLANAGLQFNNAVFKIDVSKLDESLPPSFLEKKYLNTGVTVKQMLEVYRVLHLLSISLTEKYPTNDEIVDADALLAYAPKVDIRKLAKGVNAATDINFEKISETLDFLSYRSQSDDLWCQPILHIDENHIVLLTAAFTSPNILRMVEHWLVKLDVDLAEKGYFYEGNVVTDIRDALNGNAYFDEIQGPVTKRLKIRDNEEEIDFLMKIGSSVIVGEAKSIVSTDSPMSYFRASQVLEKAADQAIRKTQFVKDNIFDVFKMVGFEYDPQCDYKIEPIIINSNRMKVGFSVAGVPVCDERTLLAYFEKSNFPIFSIMNEKGPEHLAWLEVYNSKETFEGNIFRYLKNLPQVLETAEDFELKETRLPIISVGSLKLIYNRLLPKEPNLSERLKRGYDFPLRTVKDIHKKIQEVDIIV
jgi:hypothetical protein